MEILDNNDEHKQLLWKILSSVERIDATLIGNSYTNNKGLVHKVEAHGELLEDIDKRVLMLESSLDNDENTEKKNQSLWGTIATWVAAIAAVLAAVFAASPKK
jgi:anti-sigma-K factor RskA